MRIGKYESSRQENVGTAVTFLMIGGVGAGALIALMLAPKTGKQMRKDLRQTLRRRPRNLAGLVRGSD